MTFPFLPGSHSIQKCSQMVHPPKKKLESVEVFTRHCKQHQGVTCVNWAFARTMRTVLVWSPGCKPGRTGSHVMSLSLSLCRAGPPPLTWHALPPPTQTPLSQPRWVLCCNLMVPCDHVMVGVLGLYADEAYLFGVSDTGGWPRC